MSLCPSERPGSWPLASTVDGNARIPAQAFILAGHFPVVPGRALHLGKALAHVLVDQTTGSLELIDPAQPVARSRPLAVQMGRVRVPGRTACSCRSLWRC